MVGQPISLEERIRREVIRQNYQDREMRGLGEGEGSVAAIRKRAAELAPARSEVDSDDVSPTEIREYPRDMRNALFLIDTIDRLARVERRLADEAAARPRRSPEELEGVSLLSRATLVDHRDNS